MSALRLRGATVRFGTGAGSVVAVDGVDLELEAGQSLGLVGESGSGKSTLGRAVVGLIPLTAGEARIGGDDVRSRSQRGRLQLVFQDPYASLDPRMTIGESIGEGLRRRRSERTEAVARLLEQVGLDSEAAGALPRQLSGGQRQRVALARALAAEPSVLVADEITSALDVSVQGAILNLVRQLQRAKGFSLLFISHNLAVVRYVADTIAVMYCGRIVEVAPTERLVAEPQHPYTRSLLATVPRLGQRAGSGPDLLEADPADPAAPPPGCRFHPRCPIGPFVRPERSACLAEDPGVEAATRPHRAACFYPPARPSGAREPVESRGAT